MMNGDGDSTISNFVLAKLQVSASPKMASQNQNRIISPKRERGYCISPQHGCIETNISSIPHTSSKICPIKDHFPMAFSDS